MKKLLVGFFILLWGLQASYDPLSLQGSYPAFELKRLDSQVEQWGLKEFFSVQGTITNGKATWNLPTSQSYINHVIPLIKPSQLDLSKLSDFFKVEVSNSSGETTDFKKYYCNPTQHLPVSDDTKKSLAGWAATFALLHCQAFMQGNKDMVKRIEDLATASINNGAYKIFFNMGSEDKRFDNPAKYEQLKDKKYLSKDEQDFLNEYKNFVDKSYPLQYWRTQQVSQALSKVVGQDYFVGELCEDNKDKIVVDIVNKFSRLSPLPFEGNKSFSCIVQKDKNIYPFVLIGYKNNDTVNVKAVSLSKDQDINNFIENINGVLSVELNNKNKINPYFLNSEWPLWSRFIQTCIEKWSNNSSIKDS